MTEPAWDRLVEQVSTAPKARARRAACRKLAATGNPAAIPYLRTAYLNDEDEGVREAARQGLAQFKAQQEGHRAGRIRLNPRLLRGTFWVLGVLFLLSLGLNALTLVMESTSDATPTPGFRFDRPPSPREQVIAQVESHLREVERLAADLRGEINHFNATGQVSCDLNYQLPTPVGLQPIDEVTYPDLRIAALNVDVTLPTLQKALLLLQGACKNPAAQTERALQAAMELDKVDNQLREASQQLQTAITNPAPTVGPTVTPLPTHTPTSVPSATPAPPTPTGQATVTAPPEATLSPTVSPTASNTPTPIPSPTATLPFPDLDYKAILRALRERYVIIGDLQNNFGTGMIDQWEQALSPQGQTSVRGCTLNPWPAPFDFSPEDRAKLDAPDVADPQLEDAVRLQQEGIALALQARSLYEATCSNYNLASSAEQGLALANQALQKLVESQLLYDLIRAR
jgi:hypothetical protein